MPAVFFNSSPMAGSSLTDSYVHAPSACALGDESFDLAYQVRALSVLDLTLRLNRLVGGVGVGCGLGLVVVGGVVAMGATLPEAARFAPEYT